MAKINVTKITQIQNECTYVATQWVFAQVTTVHTPGTTQIKIKLAMVTCRGTQNK